MSIVPFTARFVLSLFIYYKAKLLLMSRKIVLNGVNYYFLITKFNVKGKLCEFLYLTSYALSHFLISLIIIGCLCLFITSIERILCNKRSK